MKIKLNLEGIKSPISLKSNAEGKIFIAEQVGNIYEITSDGTLTLFLQLTDLLVKLKEDYEERGLLDFAFHPDYPQDSRLFVYYSTPNESSGSGDGKESGGDKDAVNGNGGGKDDGKGNDEGKEGNGSGGGKNGEGKDDVNYSNCLSEITISGSEIDESILFRVEKEVNFHNSGRMEFGPDGYLYLTIGDGGPKQGDPENRSQRLDTVFGKVLRIDVNTPHLYKIPQDNPFATAEGIGGASSLIYAYGLRNPWGISFDTSENLFLADVGYSSIEEINIIVKGGNYGWNIKEGTMKTTFGGKNVTGSQLIDPIFEYSHDWVKSLPSFGPEKDPKKKGIAVIGGYPLTDGSYIFGDLSGLIMRIKQSKDGNRDGNRKWSIIDQTTIDKYIKGFGKDSSGKVYVLCCDSMGPYGKGYVYTLE